MGQAQRGHAPASHRGTHGFAEGENTATQPRAVPGEGWFCSPRRTALCGLVHTELGSRSPLLPFQPGELAPGFSQGETSSSGVCFLQSLKASWQGLRAPGRGHRCRNSARNYLFDSSTFASGLPSLREDPVLPALDGEPPRRAEGEPALLLQVALPENQTCICMDSFTRGGTWMSLIS